MSLAHKRTFWNLGGWFTMMWVGIASIAVGAGTAVYGADKQRKANNQAIDANNANADKTNQSAWNSYLLSRGVNPAGAVTGQLPTNAQAVNTKLPLWAAVSRPGTAAKGFRIGGAGSGPKLALGGTGFSQPAAPVDASALAGSGSGGGNGNNIKDILIGNPLGIGGKDRSWYDPLGIF